MTIFELIQFAWRILMFDTGKNTVACRLEVKCTKCNFIFNIQDNSGFVFYMKHIETHR